MAFTNVFDNTQPPDTQAANLLGQDIRNFKVDIQQRVAAMSGLDANKPTFNLDAQPTAWNGCLYFATDTGKIYQFGGGTTWTDITSRFYQSSAFQSQVSLIPGGLLNVGSRVNIMTAIQGSSGPLTVTIGGVALPAVNCNANLSTAVAEFDLIVNAANSLVGIATFRNAGVINQQAIAPSGGFNFAGSSAVAVTSPTGTVVATKILIYP
jgi:hypothetical protein